MAFIIEKKGGKLIIAVGIKGDTSLLFTREKIKYSVGNERNENLECKKKGIKREREKGRKGKTLANEMKSLILDEGGYSREIAIRQWLGHCCEFGQSK